MFTSAVIAVLCAIRFGQRRSPTEISLFIRAAARSVFEDAELGTTKLDSLKPQ